MRYYYRASPPDLSPYVGAFYLMEMPEAAGDLVRVEIPHIRFLCKGISTLSHGDETRAFDAQEVLVCGPSFRTGSVSVTAGTLILGASLTPLGWYALIGCPASDMANRKAGIKTLRPEIDTTSILGVLDSATSDEELFEAAETFLRGAVRDAAPARYDFIKIALDWITDPESPSVPDLIARTGLSSRQVDRLCREYFGGSPKQVHRVFRALNIAYRLTTEEDTAVQDIAGPYFDQSHLIRDFRDRIGCTPREFRQSRVNMMRFDVALRQAIPDLPRYALIG
ncbi:MAG: AraC family transcriptional regulator [Pseudomonadota bacterium]